MVDRNYRKFVLIALDNLLRRGGHTVLVVPGHDNKVVRANEKKILDECAKDERIRAESEVRYGQRVVVLELR